MKRIRLFAILLCTLCVFAVQAGAVSITAEDMYFNNITSDGTDVLVSVTSGSMQNIYKLEGEEVTPLFEPMEVVYNADALAEEERAALDKRITMLVPSNEGMYALAPYGKQLYKWNAGAFEAVGAPLVFEGLDFNSVSSATVSGNMLYVIMNGNVENDYRSIVIVLDITSGEGKAMKTEISDYIMRMTPYKDGNVLVMYQSKEDDYMPVLRVFDGANDALADKPIAVLDSYNAGGLSYDASTDSIYYSVNSQLFVLSGREDATLASYIPNSYINNAVICGEEYFYVYGEAMVSVSKNPQDLPDRVLTVQSYIDDATLKAFNKAYPDIPVITADSWYGGTQEIAEAIKTGEKSIDIFRASIEGALRSITSKGYAADLSSSQSLVSAADAFYPALKDSVTDKQGRLMAIPADLHVNNLVAVNADLWEKFDLGEYPETYSEYIDLLQRWEDEFAEDNPEYCFAMIYTKEGLINQAVSSYIYQYEQTDKAISFDSPELREVLEKIEALGIEQIDWNTIGEDEFNAYYNRTAILNTYANCFAEGTTMYPEGTTHVLPPFVFSKGETAKVVMNGEMFFVNPESENIDLAIKLLEIHLQTNASMGAMSTPTQNDPIRIENFEKNVKSMQGSLEEMKARLEVAEDIDKVDIEDSIKWIEAWLADSDKNQWDVSQEGIDRFREIDDAIITNVDSVFMTYDNGNSGMTELYEVLGRYTDGQLTLDQFIREVDQKSKMIYLEGAMAN